MTQATLTKYINQIQYNLMLESEKLSKAYMIHSPKISSLEFNVWLLEIWDDILNRYTLEAEQDSVSDYVSFLSPAEMRTINELVCQRIGLDYKFDFVLTATDDFDIDDITQGSTLYLEANNLKPIV